MRRLIFEGRDIPVDGDQTVLDAIHAAGEWLSFGCRSGNCQTCLVRCIDGEAPAEAQRGLSEGLRLAGHFLACQARSGQFISCVRPDHESLKWSARVISNSRVSHDILRLRFERPEGFTYRAGQYISIWRDGSVGRAYSLTSLLEEDDWLECYLRILPDGYMSHWLANDLERGETLTFRGPAGDCFYHADAGERPLLLAGSGVGMAPLTGVLRDALRQGHTGPIRVYHGVREASDLVFDEFLSTVAAEFPDIRYTPCIGRNRQGETAIESRLFADLPDLSGFKVMLCGGPAVVSRLRQRIFLSGASSRDIHADEFVSRGHATAD